MIYIAGFVAGIEILKKTINYNGGYFISYRERKVGMKILGLYTAKERLGTLSPIP